MKNENIVCVTTRNMQQHFDLSRNAWHASVEAINLLPFTFVPRPEAENDFSLKQLIPYAIVVDNEGKVLCYQRAGSEKRLSGIWSAGIGGHVNDLDAGESLYNILLNGLQREFHEEIGIELEPKNFSLAGMINEEETEVGHCHTGVVFKVTLPCTSLSFDSEISNPHWFAPHDIDYSKFELWSALAIKLLTKTL